MNKVKIEHHIKHLQEKHGELEERLKKNPPEYISRVIKKEKLQLKDEIAKLQKNIQ